MRVMRPFHLSKVPLLTVAAIIFSIGCISISANEASPPVCQQLVYDDVSYTACIIPPDDGVLELFHTKENGETYGHFSAVRDRLKSQGRELRFAMNGGMYHPDHAPVGLYIEDHIVRAPLRTRASKDNFGMLPNGVFYADYTGLHVRETLSFGRGGFNPQFATQSGPMLVIDGERHPRFRERSTSKRIRNGVGILDDGRAVFIISDERVNFYTFASVFRDHYGAENALYLDGVISRLYAPDIGRHDGGARMGPIIAWSVNTKSKGEALEK